MKVQLIFSMIITCFVLACGSDSVPDDNNGVVGDVGTDSTSDTELADMGSDAADGAEADTTVESVIRVSQCANNLNTTVDDCPYGQCRETGVSDSACDDYDSILTEEGEDLCAAGDVADYALNFEKYDGANRTEEWSILVHCEEGTASTERCDQGVAANGPGGRWGCVD